MGWWRIWSPDSPYTKGTPATGGKYYEAWLSGDSATDLVMMLRLITGDTWYCNEMEDMRDSDYIYRSGYDEHTGKDGKWMAAENWGGDPEGKLAKALERARKKAKQPRKPLKIERLKAESFGAEPSPNENWKEMSDYREWGYDDDGSYDGAYFVDMEDTQKEFFVKFYFDDAGSGKACDEAKEKLGIECDGLRHDKFNYDPVNPQGHVYWVGYDNGKEVSIYDAPYTHMKIKESDKNRYEDMIRLDMIRKERKRLQGLTTVFNLLQFVKHNKEIYPHGSWTNRNMTDYLPKGNYRAEKGKATKSKLYYGSKKRKEIEEGDVLNYHGTTRLHYDTNVAFDVPIYDYDGVEIKYQDYHGRPTKRGKGNPKNAYFDNALFSSQKRGSHELPLTSIPSDWLWRGGHNSMEEAFYNDKFRKKFNEWISKPENEKMVEDEYNKSFGAESFGAEAPSYMADSDAHKLIEGAWRINSFVESGEEYPQWWKSKLSVAASNVDDLADYLDYAMSDDYDAETFNASTHNPYSVDLYEDEDTPPYYPYLAPEYTTVHGRGRYRFNRYNSDGMTWYQYRFPTKDKAIEWLCYQSHTYVQVKPNQPQYDFPPNTPDSEIKKWHRAESYGAETRSLAKRSWDALNNIETAVGTVGLAHMIGFGAIFGGGLAFLKGRKSNSKTEK